MWSSTALCDTCYLGAWRRLILALVLVAACGEANHPPPPPAATPALGSRSRPGDAPSPGVGTPQAIDAWQTERTVLHLAPPPAGDGPPPELYDISFVTDERGFGVASKGGIYRTNDGGDSWHEVYRLDGSQLSRVQFLDGATGFATGVRGCAPDHSCAGPGVLLRTADGGDHWELIEPQGFQNLVRSWDVPERRAHLWSRMDFTLASSQVAFATDNPAAGFAFGEALVTTDGGRTWQAVAFADGFRPHSISFPTPEQGFVTGRTGESEHQLRASHDGGRTWQVVYSTAAMRLDKVQFLDDSLGFVAGTALTLDSDELRPGHTLLHTTDGGLTWEPLYTWDSDLHSPSTTMGLTFLWFRFANPLMGWATRGRCDWRVSKHPCGLGVMATSDGGRTWTPTSKDLGRLSSAGTTVWFLQDCVLFRSPDGGATWQQVWPVASSSDNVGRE
jgi:photosystem II stability/assembly factor-like uncharacterized protein